MQIRSFRGSGQPAWVNAPLSASFRLGSDPRRALGPAATPAAPTGRTRDRTRPMLHHVKILLPGRRPHVTRSDIEPRDVSALVVPESAKWTSSIERRSSQIMFYFGGGLDEPKL